MGSTPFRISIEIIQSIPCNRKEKMKNIGERLKAFNV
jgi:hypothetical protein